MKEVFEKIVERLDSHIEIAKSEGDFSYIKPFEIAKGEVQNVAEEYNNGWIACSERLPEDNGVYFVTLDDDIMPRCIDVRNFRNGVFEQRFIVSPLQGKCPEEKVVAWMSLPEPYKEND